MARINLIQKRRDTATNWTSVNPILAVGEEGYETDTRKSKVGDGTSTWTALSYAYPATAGVDLTTNQTVGGIKTFSLSPQVPTPTTSTDAATKAYVDTIVIPESQVTNLNSDLATKAPLASPTFTGVVTVPTPSNPTDASTKGYVDTSVSNLVASSPSTLDTLNELAAALGNDPSFATTVSTSLGLKASKGANSDITSLSGMTTALSVPQGGTGASTLTGIIKGSGTSALSPATVGTDYTAGTSALATGVLKTTTGTGVLSIAAPADFPTLNQSTTGNAATVTTNANMTGDVTSVGNATTYNNAVPVAKGGTGATATTGTGNNVLATSPTLVTPILGTPTSGVATNLTGLPLTTGVTGILPVANGGTGSGTQNFVDISTAQTNIAGNKSFNGNVTVGGSTTPLKPLHVVNADTDYAIISSAANAQGASTGIRFRYNSGAATAELTSIETQLIATNKPTLFFKTANGGTNTLTERLRLNDTDGAKLSVALTTPFVAKTAAYTLTVSDSVVTGDTTTAAFSLTLPTAASITGRKYTIKRINAGANSLTVACTGAETIDGATTYVISAQYGTVQVVSNGTAWLIVAKF